MFPISIIICLIAIGILLIIGLICEWCCKYRAAAICAVLALIAGIHPFIYAIDTPPPICYNTDVPKERERTPDTNSAHYIA